MKVTPTNQGKCPICRSIIISDATIIAVKNNIVSTPTDVSTYNKPYIRQESDIIARNSISLVRLLGLVAFGIIIPVGIRRTYNDYCIGISVFTDVIGLMLIATMFLYGLYTIFDRRPKIAFTSDGIFLLKKNEFIPYGAIQIVGRFQSSVNGVQTSYQLTLNYELPDKTSREVTIDVGSLDVDAEGIIQYWRAHSYTNRD